MSSSIRCSLIVNTCSADPLAGQPVYGMRSYRERMALLRDEILPAAAADGWDEIIVCGQFVDGPGWRYVAMPPVYRDRRDALWQRELGARHATGDILAFSHDDHMFAKDTPAAIAAHDPEWDLLVPQRLSRAGAVLDNGRAAGYMGGHSLVMKRWLWARIPWTSVDTDWWDLTMTRLWREEGARIVWTDTFAHIDMDTLAAEPEHA